MTNVEEFGTDGVAGLAQCSNPRGEGDECELLKRAVLILTWYAIAYCSSEGKISVDHRSSSIAEALEAYKDGIRVEASQREWPKQPVYPPWNRGNVLQPLVLGGILTGFYLWRRDLVANILAHTLVDLVGTGVIARILKSV